MIKNISVYLAILAAAFVFNIFYYMWFSWILLLILAALPLLSLVFSLPFMMTSAANGLVIFAKDSYEAGDELKIGFCGKKGRAVFCPAMKIKLKTENRFTHFQKTEKLFHSGGMKQPFFLKTKITLEHCGTVDISVKSCRIYDFMGLFFIPIKMKDTKNISVFPKPESPKLLPDSKRAAIIGYKPKSGGGFSDDYELRPFADGDSLRSVHWKLSSKHDELIVREPSLPVYRRLAFRLDLTGKAITNDNILARFFDSAQHMLNNGESCLCYDAQGRLCEIKNTDDLRTFTVALYCGGAFPRTSTDDVSMLYIISENGEEVCEQ